MDKMNTSDKAAEAAPAPLPRAMSRRRFATAGLGGAGALLTIVSAPSMAASVSCASPSGTLSGDLYNSHNTPDDIVCGGLSHGYYKGAGLNEWKAYHHVCFGATGMFSCQGKNKASTYSKTKTYSNTTLLELLNKQSFDSSNMGMQLTTVWLNIKLGKINFLKVADLQAIWNEWQLTGGYTPRGGMKPWTTREIVAYLEKTFS